MQHARFDLPAHLQNDPKISDGLVKQPRPWESTTVVPTVETPAEPPKDAPKDAPKPKPLLRVILKVRGWAAGSKKAKWKKARKGGYAGGNHETQARWTAAENKIILQIAEEVEVKAKGGKLQHKWESVNYAGYPELQAEHRNGNAVRNQWQKLVKATKHTQTKAGATPNKCLVCLKWLNKYVMKASHSCEFYGLTDAQRVMLAEKKKKEAAAANADAAGALADFAGLADLAGLAAPAGPSDTSAASAAGPSDAPLDAPLDAPSDASNEQRPGMSADTAGVFQSAVAVANPNLSNAMAWA